METKVPEGSRAPVQGSQAAAQPRMSYEEFLASPLVDEHAEWVEGAVVPMSPVSQSHARVKGFLYWLLYGYVSDRRLGRVFDEPFQMKTGPELPGRAPDIMVIANEHLGRLHETYLEGPADLVVEVVSPESRSRDRGDKFDEYERGGVREYWIIDPERERAEFYVMDAQGVFRAAPVAEDGTHHSAVLEGLSIQAGWLWQDPPPVVEALGR